MMRETPATSRWGGWVSAGITVVFLVSAILLVGFRLALAVGPMDTEALESPLILSVARQLVAGPGGLYGPFGSDNPLVLIHAPLYYRTAALVAWPMARAGVDPVTAARIAGRTLSALGFLATLVMAYSLATLDGLPRRAGWWAVLLIAAAPVLDGQPVAVRPDMAGVALQTLGVLLVLARLRCDRPRGTGLLWAYAALALAACIKQHFVAAAGVSTGLLILARWRGRVSSREIQQGLLMAAAVVATVYGLETLATGGRVGQAAFEAAAAVGRVHPGDWLHVITVAVAALGRSPGLVALLAAAGLAAIADRPGRNRWLFAAGTFLVGSIAGLSALQLGLVRLWVSGLLVAVLVATVTLIVPACACATIAPRRSPAGEFPWIDAGLWAALAGELVLALALARLTTGAWINYAIQAVVFAAVLTARALARTLSGTSSRRSTLPAALAAGAVLAAALMEIKEVVSRRRAEDAALAQVFVYAHRAPSEYFFADRPGLNRVFGRLDLVFDGWLYPVFEATRLAQPRAQWLGQVLAAGPSRVVVSSSEIPRVDGVPDPLPALGYRSAVRIGPFLVWTR